MTPAERSRNLRYKRPALASMGYDAMTSELDEIYDKCSDVRWWMDTDTETLLNALDGDEEDAWEFKMAFAELEAKSEQLREMLYGVCRIDRDVYDKCTVALIGNRYNLVGFDDYEEDYFSLCGYESHLAEEESGKRFMRLTKKEMISTIGQCFGILMAFLDVRQRYDYLQATFDILRDQNTSLLDTIKEIENLYEETQDRWNSSAEQKWHNLTNALPEELWVM
ncbi:MAG: hypothetical protein IKN55_10515 [Oscillospiraceae bacterium]|nr:hypothetical protein [Oscillospiraceae bacterium]